MQTVGSSSSEAAGLASERVERRLTAILAADVAGYSRLTGADEEGTLERLRALRREVVDPALAEHHGRLVKTTGDGLLVEFASVVDAVRCAVEVQREMADRNKDVPAEGRIEFRMGINVGDIIIEEGSLYGEHGAAGAGQRSQEPTLRRYPHRLADHESDAGIYQRAARSICRACILSRYCQRDSLSRHISRTERLAPLAVC